MHLVSFDALSASKRLQLHGLPAEQAEAIAEELRNATGSMLDFNVIATKHDVESVKQDVEGVRGDLEELKEKVAYKTDLREMELKLTNQIQQVQIRLGSMILALGGVLIGVKYFG